MMERMATQLGKEAAEKGLARDPLQNKEFMEFIHELENEFPGETFWGEMSYCWLYGYDRNVN